jgi:hypothetical protein
MKVARLSALRTGRLYPQEMSRSQGHSAPGRIMSMKNSNYTIGNRFHDLPVCSAVPQPLRHRAPHEHRVVRLFRPTRKGIPEGMRELHRMMLHKLCWSPKIVRMNKIKARVMRRIWRTQDTTIKGSTDCTKTNTIRSPWVMWFRIRENEEILACNTDKLKVAWVYLHSMKLIHS